MHSKTLCILLATPKDAFAEGRKGQFHMRVSTFLPLAHLLIQYGIFASHRVNQTLEDIGCALTIVTVFIPSTIIFRGEILTRSSSLSMPPPPRLNFDLIGVSLEGGFDMITIAVILDVGAIDMQESVRCSRFETMITCNLR